MPKQWRPAEVLNALKRLGYRDKPGRGDHVSLFKALPDHPDGKVTVQAGIDMGVSPCSKHDIGRIKRTTKLKDDMWERAMSKKLTRVEYDEYLKAIPKADLVVPFWRPIVEAKQRPDHDA